MFRTLKLYSSGFLLGVIGFVGIYELYSWQNGKDILLGFQILCFLGIVLVPMIIGMLLYKTLEENGVSKNVFLLTLFIYAIIITFWVVYMSIYSAFFDNDFYPVGLMIYLGLGLLLSYMVTLCYRAISVSNHNATIK